RDWSHVLPLGESGQLARADDLEIAETRRHAPEGDDERHRQEQDPRAEQRGLHGWSGTLVTTRAPGRLAVILPPAMAAAPLPPMTNSRATRIWRRVGVVRPSSRARDSTRAGDRRVATSTSSRTRSG